MGTCPKFYKVDPPLPGHFCEYSLMPFTAKITDSLYCVICCTLFDQLDVIVCIYGVHYFLVYYPMSFHIDLCICASSVIHMFQYDTRF